MSCSLRVAMLLYERFSEAFRGTLESGTRLVVMVFLTSRTNGEITQNSTCSVAVQTRVLPSHSAAR